ncbi:MAG TPA: MoaD/ThiS family protein [Candidatus Baltobacteraceae bacterium]|nr:MoaD/ThiS family protein [Candidatus Baltobacteraceae bacterium]
MAAVAMTVVVLPRSLAALFPGMPHRLTLERGPETVGEVIAALDARWPGVRDRLCEAGPALRPFINVYVDGEPGTFATPVPGGSTVHVLPAVAGG